MTANEDRPTIPESYVRAVSSKHLEVTFRRGDVDMLIASGWARDSLGTDLYRLRAEFDAVRLDVLAYNSELPRWLARADQLEREGQFIVAHSLRREALSMNQTERYLALSQMKTLAPTALALGRFASLQATRRRFMEPDDVVAQIAGRALDLWLDPTCHHCAGRGFSGAPGTPTVICKHCHGSGLRKPQLGHTDLAHEFGRFLLCEMDRKTSRVAQSMKRHLSTNE